MRLFVRLSGIANQRATLTGSPGALSPPFFFLVQVVHKDGSVQDHDEWRTRSNWKHIDWNPYLDLTSHFGFREVPGCVTDGNVLKVQVRLYSADIFTRAS